MIPNLVQLDMDLGDTLGDMDVINLYPLLLLHTYFITQQRLFTYGKTIGKPQPSKIRVAQKLDTDSNPILAIILSTLAIIENCHISISSRSALPCFTFLIRGTGPKSRGYLRHRQTRNLVKKNVFSFACEPAAGRSLLQEPPARIMFPKSPHSPDI